MAKPRVVASTVEGEEKETHKVRTCVDLTKLNESVMRDKHDLPIDLLTIRRPNAWSASGSKGVHKAGCQLRVLANSNSANIPRTNDLHNSPRQILLPTFAIWDNISPRTLPEEDAQGPGRSSRSVMHDG